MFDANNLQTLMSGELGEAKSVGAAVIRMFNDTMAEGKSRIAPGGLEKTEDGFIFTLENGEEVPVNVFEKELVDGKKVQQDDDVIAQAFATALGLSVKDVRQKFKDQGVDLGDFKPETFTTFKSKPAMRAPMYNRPMTRGDDESPTATQYLAENFGLTLGGNLLGGYAAKNTNEEIEAGYNALIDSYWNENALGGVNLRVGSDVNGRFLLVKIDGVEQDPIAIPKDMTPGRLWDKLTALELKVRTAKDKANVRGEGTDGVTDTSQY